MPSAWLKNFAGKSHQSFLRVKTADITDLSHKLRTYGWLYIKHLHYHRISYVCNKVVLVLMIVG